jgi:D-alanyl-D-alanine carboxypeptidase/D-alanyl-D-alanine-endopeptidase (penicillin-binding protein 4)
MSYLFKCFFFILLTFQAFPERDFEYLEGYEKKGARVSAMVVDLSSGEVIAQKNPNMALSPASSSKIILAAKALDDFGGDFSFTTQFITYGKLNDRGVLRGNLIFYGQGDPSLVNERLWNFVNDVKRYGIRTIQGNLVINTSYFGKITELDENRRGGKKTSTNAYSGPLSSAAVNYSVLPIVVVPAKKHNARARVYMEPFKIKGYEIQGKVVTSKHAKKPKIHVQRKTYKDREVIFVSGVIPKDYGFYRVYRSVSNPEIYTGRLLESFLDYVGVRLMGSVVVSSKVPRPEYKVVSEVSGEKMYQMVNQLMRISNNFITDMLSLHLLKNNKSHNIDLFHAGSFLEYYLRKEIIKSRFNDKSSKSNNIVIKAVSGLSPENKVSARQMVSLLDRYYFNDMNFPAFLAAFPSPGYEGTLKRRFSNSTLQQRLKECLKAKTGTLTLPVDVVSLSGYSRTKDQRWSAFSVIVNGSQSHRNFGIERLRHAIDIDISRILNSYK